MKVFRRGPSSTERKLDQITEQLNRMEYRMTNIQGEIDAEVAILTTDEATIKAGFAALKAQIAALEAQGVDVTGLKAVEAIFTADAAADAPPAPPAP